jgi:hypothetical protein
VGNPEYRVDVVPLFLRIAEASSPLRFILVSN